VLASAVVDRDGSATVTGPLPVDVLGLGEHRIRLVGTRAFDEVGVDADGGIALPASVLAEIERFDRGTDATVLVYGVNGAGGDHVSRRIVPLDPVAPWWTLLLPGVVGALSLRARRRGGLTTRRAQAAAAGAVIVAAAPAVVLGWLATTTVVAFVGVALALLLAGAVLTVRTRDVAPPDEHAEP
jgi:hypothetical protein